MTDVDMELDIVHATGLDGHVDDDLIDYDDDDVEFSGTTWKTNHDGEQDQILIDEDEHMQMHGEDKISHPSTQTMPDIPLSQTEDEIVVDHHTTADNDTPMPASVTVEVSTGEPSTAVSATHTEINIVTEDQSPNNDRESVANGGPGEQQDGTGIGHIDEIDYEDDEVDGSASGTTRVVQEALRRASDESPSYEQEDELAKLEESQHGAASDNDTVSHNQGASTLAHEEATKGEDEQELTWEDDGVDLGNSATEQNPAETVVHTLSDQAGSNSPSYKADDSEQVGEELDPNLVSTEWGEEGHNGDSQHRDPTESDDNTQDDLGQSELAQVGVDEEYAETHDDDYTYAELDAESRSPHDDSHYPAVTVSYKGEEYPLASESPDAFFSDPSVQDLSIKDLLAQFRDVLGEEVSLAQELVFKVDELGLEFFETSPHDLISGNTMRGILDIFDVLVRNQDPDKSRVLYSYLYSKPNAAKRLEFLTESAANGVGLDEVSLLHDFSIPHVSSGNHTDYDGDDDAGKHELTEEDTMARLDYDAGSSYNDGFGNSAANDGDETGRFLESKPEELHQLEGDTVGEPGKLDVAGHTGEATHEPGQSDGVADSSDHTITAEQATAYDEDESGINIDSTVAVAEFIAQDPPEDDHNAHSTITVKPTDAAPGTEEELDFNLNQDKDSSLALKDEDLLSEIDWHDPSAPDAETKEMTPGNAQDGPPTPTSVTKRSRPEDEVDLDTLQDTKRIRF